MENFKRLMQASQGVRRLGSAALDLAYVACGRLDGYWEYGIHSWDIAAGALMVEAAGGLVTSINGDADYFKPPYPLLAASPVIHAAMLATLEHF
jgi:myo-inositol-1(or 4)-monophosphatase